MPGTLLLVDTMPLLYRGHFAFASRPRMTTGGVNTSAIYLFATSIAQMVAKEGVTHVALAMDTSPTFRHERYPDYKAQREKMPEDIAASIPMAEAFAKAMRIPFLRVEGFEADDVIGTLAARGDAAGMDVRIFTPDKDFAQLVTDHVTLCRPSKGDAGTDDYAPDGVREHWGVPSPERIIDLLALEGDSVDNIPGVAGVGEKTAVKLLQEYGSLEGVLSHAGDIKGKLGERIREHAEDARLSYWLATIRRDVPVAESLDDLKLREPDLPAVEAFCREYELGSLLRRLCPGAALEGAPKSAPAEASADAAEAGAQEDAAQNLDTAATTPHSYRTVRTAEDLAELAAELKAADEFAFDTETDGLDPRSARAVGLSFSTKPGTGWYVPLGPAGAGPAQVDKSEVNKSTVEKSEVEKSGVDKSEAEKPPVVPAAADDLFSFFAPPAPAPAPAPEAPSPPVQMDLFGDFSHPVPRTGDLTSPVSDDIFVAGSKERELVASLADGSILYPRFTPQEIKASHGPEHEQLWHYILGLESSQVHPEGGGGFQAEGERSSEQHGEAERALVRLGTRLGRDSGSEPQIGGKFLGSGSESRVFSLGNGYVRKIRRIYPVSIGHILDDIGSVVFHNYLFPEDAYRLVGIFVFDEDGRDGFCLVLDQKMVTPLTDASGCIVAPTYEQIAEALRNGPEHFSLYNMEESGEEDPEGLDVSSAIVGAARFMAYNGQFQVYDFKPGENTFIDAETGRVRFLDPRISVNDPDGASPVAKYGKRRPYAGRFDLAAAWEMFSSRRAAPAEQRLAPEAIRAALAPVFADPAKTKCGHNVKFDLHVLRTLGIEAVPPFADSMLAHYVVDSAQRHGMDPLSREFLHYDPIPIEALIGPKGKGQLTMDKVDVDKVAEYAAEDADVTLRLHRALEPVVRESGAWRAYAEAENPLVRVLADMEDAGVRIDTDALARYSVELGEEMARLVGRIQELAGEPFNLDSPQQLGHILFERLGLPAASKTSTGRWSTAEDVLQGLATAHPIIPAILDYRAVSKLKSTYVDKLPQCIDPRDGRVHTTFNQALTETGRLSSDNPNLQNIPVRTELGQPIRAAFTARDDGHVLVSADYSQIELRVLASMSGDEAMCEDFRKGSDIHAETAARVHGISAAEVTREQRAQAKRVNFGIVYGISAFGLGQRLGIPRKQAADLIAAVKAAYPGIARFMERSVEEARANGFARTLLGRRRPIRDIASRNGTLRAAAERLAVNTPVQGSAADIIKLAMIAVDEEIRRRRLGARMILQIHDELLFDVPREEVDEVCALVRERMTGVIELAVPLVVDVGMGRTWLDAH